MGLLNFTAIAADVRINPDLSAYTWIEFYRATELIERGVEAAEQAVPEIKRVLAERLVAAAGDPQQPAPAVGATTTAAPTGHGAVLAF